jgi:hypothetical protein
MSPIQTESDYKKALDRVEELWGAERGTEDGDKLEALVTAVDAYVKTKRTTLKEAISDVMHQAWAHWTDDMLSALRKAVDDDYISGACDGGHGFEDLALVTLWRRQIETPYAELSETEKSFRREWAGKAVKIFNEVQVERWARLREHVDEWLNEVAPDILKRSVFSVQPMPEPSSTGPKVKSEVLWEQEPDHD